VFAMTVAEIARACNGQFSRDAATIGVRGIGTDSRQVAEGSAFIGIKGERFDGNAHAADALAAGAAICVTNRNDLGDRAIVVSDTTLALQQIAKAWRDRFAIPVLGLTGSNGKTTVKEMMREILIAHAGDRAFVLATRGNLNNHIGVPLMLAELDRLHRYAVFEAGMNHFGEIRVLTHLIAPHVALINNAGPAHLEHVGSLDGVARAKGELIDGLSSHGVAVLNADDPYISYWRSRVLSTQRVITFGTSDAADVRGLWQSSNANTSMRIVTTAADVELDFPLVGNHNRMNALAACAGGIALGVPLPTIVHALTKFAAVAGRQKVIQGRAGSIIIDDTYNANPASMRAAVESLVTTSGRRILVLGPMAELGVDSEALHAQIGALIGASGIETFFATGDPMRAATLRCDEISNGKARWFASKTSLVEALLPMLQEGVTVLIKGSRSSAMEEVVRILVQSQEQFEETH
jgi:UDP-N-acetylmuramoyl-tripeptide--D-alanyl-D-alanine ligase